MCSDLGSVVRSDEVQCGSSGSALIVQCNQSMHRRVLRSSCVGEVNLNQTVMLFADEWALAHGQPKTG